MKSSTKPATTTRPAKYTKIECPYCNGNNAAKACRNCNGTGKVSVLEKRSAALTNKEVAKLAVRIFNGESQTKIAKDLGISASYLSRLIKKAEKAGAFRYSVARD